MIRSLRLVAALLVAVPAGAQDLPAAHRLPFGSRGNALELAVGAPAGAARTSGLSVVVASSPAWLSFETERAEAAATEDGGEPVARLAFDVSPAAPVGETGEIVLHVVDAAGAVVAEHVVRVEAEAPRELSLAPPRPNPSAGSAVLAYAVPEAGRVRVSVFDALGREVLTLADGEVAAGGYEARIPAGRLASGVYAVRLTAASGGGAGGEARTVRLTVVR